MSEVSAYLSPNGDSLTRGNGPATRLLVATLEGVAELGRDTPQAPWHLAGRSLAHRHIGSLVYEAGSGKLFAGAHADGGLWVSDDGQGQAWRQLTDGLDRPHIYCVAARRQGGKTALFAGTSPAGLYRSDDLGESWVEVTSIFDVRDTDKWTFPPPPHIPHVKNVVFHPTEPDTVFALVEQGAFLRSTDDGKTWTDLTAYSEPDDVAYRDVHRLLIDPDDPDRFFLATGEGLYRSRDGGKTFDHLTHRGERMGYPDFLFFDPDDRDIVYMAGSYLNPAVWFKDGRADSCVMRSVDDGATWEEIGEGLPDPFIGAIEAMSIHHWDGGMMLVIGTATGEVFATENHGASWTCLSDAVTPVSKDDHHYPFMTPEERDRVKTRLSA